MAVSVRTKLSHLWARAARQPRVYSHVFVENKTLPLGAPVNGEYQYSHDINRYHWIEARPFNGNAGEFRLTHCTYDRIKTWGAPGNREMRREPIVLPESGRAVVTREEARAVISAHEQGWAKLGYLPTIRQPFRARIETSLIP